MKRTDADKRKAEAFISILEGEVSLLRETVLEALHWDRQSDVRAAVCRIRNKAEQLAEALDVPLPKPGEIKNDH
jgi:hypothetical protein